MLRIQSTLSIIALSLLLLTACGKSDEAQQLPTQPKPASAPTSIPLSTELIPNGHWLFNPLYCKEQLPSSGVFDITIEGNNLTFIAITQNGKWTVLESPDFSKAMHDYATSEAASCFSVDTKNLVYAKYSATGTEFDVAFNPGQKAIFILSQDGIVPAKHFDYDVLSRYEFVDLEISDPYIDSNTDALIEITDVINSDEGVVYEDQQ